MSKSDIKVGDVVVAIRPGGHDRRGLHAGGISVPGSALKAIADALERRFPALNPKGSDHAG